MTFTYDDLKLIQECLMRYTDAVDGSENADAYILEQKIHKFLRGLILGLNRYMGGIVMTNHDMNELMVCAFRYSLGRMTYITGSIAHILITNKHELTESSKDVICREIIFAIENHKYGMEMDKEAWLKVLEELKND